MNRLFSSVKLNTKQNNNQCLEQIWSTDDEHGEIKVQNQRLISDHVHGMVID